MQKYKKPTFNLYRIVRLEDGLGYTGSSWDNQHYFSGQGTFWRTESKIKEKLYFLMRGKGEWVKQENTYAGGYFKLPKEEIPDERVKYVVEKYKVLELEKVTLNASALLDKTSLRSVA
jgi:hypothetical protein